MTLTDLVLPAFAQMLEALSGQLGKAREQWLGEGLGEGKPLETLMAARLAPDMLPLAAQVHFVCIQAEEARARLQNEAIEAPEAPRSFDEAEALVIRTITRLRAAGAEDRPVDEARRIELTVPGGMTFDLDLAEYIRSWAIAQFHFHLVTAYAILRHQGISLGKADYVPHMVRFLRSDGA